ncbi:BZIP transcription factor [Trifolium pratense]|uniref:BZIP transcription factor n=1 Tax=Trifolium pratense TaxID=57577 RepID=A0A2K3PJ06_TRIPR|nr:BZIP transcription factor [Trifolium pratense]
MGCSQSKLDDEESVQLCKDRKRFIKQAVEQRTRFATSHIAYIESMKRVSAALRDYIEGDEPREFSLDSVITPPFTPVKKRTNRSIGNGNSNGNGNDFIPISAKSFTPSTIEFGVGPNSNLRMNYFRPSGNPVISVEERAPAPETVRIETYSPMQQHYGMDGYFTMQSPPMNPSIFPYSPPNVRSNIPPPSPQNPQWDFFWNPFSSFDYYGYPSRSSLDQTGIDDEYRELRQVREEEGIPDLEEDETEQEDYVRKRNVVEERTRNVVEGRTRNVVEGRTRNVVEERTRNVVEGRTRNVVEERTRNDVKFSKEEVVVEDIDDDDEEEEDDEECEEGGTDDETETETEIEHDAKDSQQVHGNASFEVSKNQAAGHIESSHREMAIGKQEAKEEMAGFTVYVNRRPTSMAEVINDLEAQFKTVCNAANDVSVLLESKKAQYLLTSHEHSASKLLNPVAMFRSASSRSSSSRFLANSSSTRMESYEGSKDISDEHCRLSGSHQSTLDKLNAWEKKLYEEVKAGERIRIAYEKKCKQLSNYEVKGEDPSADKTRAAIRDLDTQITVSIHSVEAISRRIETLRDKELHPQLLELVQGLEKMWKVMAECHQTQKRTLDEAKILLAGTPSKSHSRRQQQSSMSMTDPNRLARSASNLETELRNWRNTFESWITSQRSYIQALTGWLLRCVRSEPDDVTKSPCSPHRSSSTHPLFGLIVQWSRRLDAVREKAVLDGMDFFAAGMGSLYAHQLRQDSRTNSYAPKQSGENMELVEVGHVEEEAMAPEKLAEVAIKVLCAGMSVAISSLADFAFDSAEAYSEVVKQWENVKDRKDNSSETRT